MPWATWTWQGSDWPSPCTGCSRPPRSRAAADLAGTGCRCDRGRLNGCGRCCGQSLFIDDTSGHVAAALALGTAGHVHTGPGSGETILPGGEPRLPPAGEDPPGANAIVKVAYPFSGVPTPLVDARWRTVGVGGVRRGGSRVRSSARCSAEHRHPQVPMRTHPASAGALSAASDLASSTNSATRGSATV